MTVCVETLNGTTGWDDEYCESYYNPITLIWSSLNRAQRIFRGNTCVVICRCFYCFLITKTSCLPLLSSLARGHLTQRNISHTTNDPVLHILSPSLRQDILSYKISLFDIKNKTFIFIPQPTDQIPRSLFRKCWVQDNSSYFDLWLCQFSCQPDVNVWVIWLMLLSVESFHTVDSRASCQHPSQLAVSPADIWMRPLNVSQQMPNISCSR